MSYRFPWEHQRIAIGLSQTVNMKRRLYPPPLGVFECSFFIFFFSSLRFSFLKQEIYLLESKNVCRRVRKRTKKKKKTNFGLKNSMWNTWLVGALMSRKDSSHSIQYCYIISSLVFFLKQLNTNLSTYRLYNYQLQNFSPYLLLPCLKG